MAGRPAELTAHRAGPFFLQVPPNPMTPPLLSLTKPPQDLTVVFLADMSDAYTDGKPFDGFSAGTFTDMWGREITVLPEELDLYVLNTARAIEATRDSAGAPVGLPIDVIDHLEGDGAGFMVAVTREPGANVLQFTPRWTDIGVDVLSRGIRRWFSATFNFMTKVILGGTLTNWPATRDEMGRVLLRPIELSSNLYRLSPPQGEPTMFDLKTLTAEQRAELAAALTPDLISQLGGARDGETPEQALARIKAAAAQPAAAAAVTDTPDFLSALSGAREKIEAQFASALIEQAETLEKQAGVKLAALMTGIRRSQHIAQFAQTVTAGSPAQPRALPLQPAELEKALGEMPDSTRVKVEAMLSQVLAVGLIDYAEAGKGGAQKNLQAVPDYAAGMLSQVIAAGNSVEAFFQMAGLGSAADYDLTPFIK